MIVSKFKKSLSHLLQVDERLFLSSEAPSLLLAVSGGIDSVAMAHLFKEVGYFNFAMATVNFNLRGGESDLDELLVRELAQQFKVPFYSTSFDTYQYAEEKKLSIQVAARNLRYGWFDELIEAHSFDYIAVGHNLNDSVETFFINLLRGSGLRGMAGIKEKNGLIIRPLLSISRREIAEWVVKGEIEYREDSSNALSDYSRNRLRNMVFPELAEINHAFLERIERNMENVKEAIELLDGVVEEKRGELMDSSGRKISISKLLAEKKGGYLLHSLIEPYGFNWDQVDQIMVSLKGQPGKEFHSPSHLLLKDREWLLIYPKGGDYDNFGEELIERMEIGERKSFNRGNYTITLSLTVKPPHFDVKKSRGEATRDLFTQVEFPVEESTLFVDGEGIKWPLTLRFVEEGDRFIPLGMRGYKKVSHFLTDLKIDRYSKERSSLLISNERVVALPGFRVDERFKVRPESRTILEVTIDQ